MGGRYSPTKLGSEIYLACNIVCDMGQNCEQNGHTSACVQLIGLAVACIAARGMTDGDGPPRAQQMADRILEFASESATARNPFVLIRSKQNPKSMTAPTTNGSTTAPLSCLIRSAW
jgi:hypothetical protein